MYCGVRLTCIILYNIVMCSPNKSSWPASRERFAQTFRLSLSFQTTAHQPDHYNIIIMYPTRGDFTHTRTAASVLAAGFPAVRFAYDEVSTGCRGIHIRMWLPRHHRDGCPKLRPPDTRPRY